MNPRLPATAVLLGIAGLLPLLACGAGAIALAPEKAEAYLAALVAYGAVILSFLGAVHWGFALAGGVPQAMGLRLVLGVLPSLVGWVALLLRGPAGNDAGLVVLIAGFAATVYGEYRLGRLGLVPAGYMALRWGLTTIVIAVLLGVAGARLFGWRFIF